MTARVQYPHCDARILHAPEACAYCADATDLQEERELLGISNSGLSNRAQPCPADVARGAQSYNKWPGNRATPESPDYGAAICAGHDPFTIALLLCDQDGVVREGAMHRGTDYECTGHAHFMGEHTRCTNPVHDVRTVRIA